MVGKRLEKMLGVRKRACKVNVRQEDGPYWSGGKFIVNTSLQVFDFVSSPTYSTVSGKFSLDAQVLNIEDQNCLLRLSWLTENSFLVDAEEHCLKYAVPGLVITCSVTWIPLVAVLNLNVEPLVDDEIVLIIDASERYSRHTTCFSTQQAARLPELKPWDHEIHL